MRFFHDLIFFTLMLLSDLCEIFFQYKQDFERKVSINSSLFCLFERMG